jgi:hypothetical protein
MKPLISDNYIIFALPVIFITSIFLSFVIYRLLLNRIFSGVDMDKYFDSNFSFKKKSSAPDAGKNNRSDEKE